MKIFEIVSEAEGDFEKYRQLGGNPLKLAGHLAKEVPASAASAVDKTGKLGKKLLGIHYDEPAAKSSKTSSKSTSSTAKKSVSTAAVDVTKTKDILDRLLKGESASRDDTQHLMQLKNQIDDPQLQMTLDKIQRGSTLEFTDRRSLQIYRNSL